MKRAPRDPDPAKRWLAFLRNHWEAIAAMDFFTVPTLTFGLLYGFFVVSHDRRRILHFNVTKYPMSPWIVQQLRETFPFESAPRFLIFDRDAKYGLEVSVAVRSLKMSPVRTSFKSPWQNGVAERWVKTYRRDLLDHTIAVNERHLKRLLWGMFVTTMRTARILDLERGRRTAGFVPQLRVGSVLMNDLVGCTIVTIERPSPDQLSARPYIYVQRTRARVPAPQNLRALSKQC